LEIIGTSVGRITGGAVRTAVSFTAVAVVDPLAQVDEPSPCCWLTACPSSALEVDTFSFTAEASAATPSSVWLASGWVFACEEEVLFAWEPGACVFAVPAGEPFAAAPCPEALASTDSKVSPDSLPGAGEGAPEVEIVDSDGIRTLTLLHVAHQHQLRSSRLHSRRSCSFHATSELVVGDWRGPHVQVGNRCRINWAMLAYSLAGIMAGDEI
jgi:hypothetical protein